jgi:hypothetical protein
LSAHQVPNVSFDLGWLITPLQPTRFQNTHNATPH